MCPSTYASVRDVNRQTVNRWAEVSERFVATRENSVRNMQSITGVVSQGQRGRDGRAGTAGAGPSRSKPGISGGGSAWRSRSIRSSSLTIPSAIGQGFPSTRPFRRGLGQSEPSLTPSSKSMCDEGGRAAEGGRACAAGGPMPSCRPLEFGRLMYCFARQAATLRACLSATVAALGGLCVRVGGCV